MLKILTNTITKTNIKSCIQNCKCITCWRLQSSKPLIEAEELQGTYNSNYVEIPNEKRCNCRCIWCGCPQNMKPP